MTNCIAQWLTSPDWRPTIDVPQPAGTPHNPYNEPLQPHILNMVRQAIVEQTRNGWLNLIHGFQSKQWKTLALTHMQDSSNPEDPSKGSWRLGTVVQRINAFIKLMWQAWNNALHKNDKSEERHYQSLKSAVIHHFSNQSHLLAAQDWHYCNGTLILATLVNSGLLCSSINATWPTMSSPKSHHSSHNHTYHWQKVQPCKPETKWPTPLKYQLHVCL